MEDSQIIEHEKLTKQTIEKVLNEIFSRDKASNEEKMEDFKEEYNLQENNAFFVFPILPIKGPLLFV